MLGIGCPDRHVFPFMQSPLPPPKTHRPDTHPPARAGSFIDPKLSSQLRLAFGSGLNLPLGRVFMPDRVPRAREGQQCTRP
jgi:hypothetical protein